MKTSEIAKSLARQLRKDLTPAERILWEVLRNRRFLGYKFTRQHPIYFLENNQKRFFIADFFCHELKLVIEVDGEIHKKQREYDSIREQILAQKGFYVIRFLNNQIENNYENVLNELKQYIHNLKTMK